MAVDYLSTSYINSLIQTYTESETTKLITPLSTKKTKFENLNTAYSNLSTKLAALKSSLSNLKLSDSESVFKNKTASTSNSTFVTATASGTAAKGAYEIRVNQLAKSDLLVSSNFAKNAASSLTGTHSFVVKTGDGSGGEYTSTVDVNFEAGETNETMFEKLRDAINSDKAVVQSTAKTASSSYAGGAASIKISIGDDDYVVSASGGGTYENLVDEFAAKINNSVSTVTAEKVKDTATGQVRLKITAKDNANDISIVQDSGFDVVSDLGIAATKEKSAAGMVTASTFAPDSSSVQFSLTATQSGLDYRIKSLSDVNGGTALSTTGLNLGSTRPGYDQATDPDTAGFVYTDVTTDNNQLNAKFQFNGLNFQRNSNSVTDLVNGLSITLNSVMDSGDTTVSVAVKNDNSSVQSYLETFIKNFNDVFTYIKDASASGSNKGDLYADSNASSLLSFLNSVAYTPIDGIAKDGLNMLSKIGITFDSNNGLSISDADKLTEALTNNISDVEKLFNSTSGVATKLFNQVKPYLGYAGYLANSMTSNSSTMSYLQTRMDKAQARIDSNAETLRNQYLNLQQQLATLQTTMGNYGYSAS